jgi:hypothetical protein
VILRIAKSTRPADADLRESYRQRLNEIFDLSRSSVDIQEPLLEPVTTVVPVEARVELNTPTVNRRANPVQPAAPSPEELAPVPTGTTPDALPPAADTLGQAAERVAMSLIQGLAAIMGGQERRRSAEIAKIEAIMADTQNARDEVSELRDLVRAQQRLIEEQVAAAISRIDGRLNSQAEVIRDLSGSVSSQQSRWSEYRAAVEKLKTLTEVSNLPAHLPDNL